MSEWLKLVYFVPESHLETTKQAVFDAGAGQQGDYDQCAWQCLGQGQFRPGTGANPWLGQAGELESVAEYRVETLMPRSKAPAVLHALRSAHPYEEPAFECFSLVSEHDLV